MNSTLNTARLAISLLVWTMLGSACAVAPLGTIPSCLPPLPAPPDSVLDALDTAAQKDPHAGQWTVDLEKHYEQQDACAKRRGK